MPNTSVYYVDASYEADRPEIDMRRTPPWDDWKELDQPFPPGVDTIDCRRLTDFFSRSSDASQWDYYNVAGSMLSERALRLLWPFAKQHFRCMKTRLNGEPFYFLRPVKDLALDCLDEIRSEILYFRCEPRRVQDIRRHVFRFDICGPLVFHIPESNAVFCTEEIRSMVQKEGLRGFRFSDVNPAKQCRDPSRTSYIYENHCIGIRLQIPDNWEIRCIAKGNVRAHDPTNPGPSRYQRTDDDLPSIPHDYRNLVAAELVQARFDCNVEASIRITVFMTEEIDANECEKQFIHRMQAGHDGKKFSDGNFSIGGIEGHFVQVSRLNEWGDEPTHRFCHWYHIPQLLVEAAISGSDLENFDHALSVFSKIERLGTG